MSYVIARENFKEAGRHVSAETDPVMFNLLYGLQSLTTQIESDFAALWAALRELSAPLPIKSNIKPNKAKAPGKKRAVTKTRKKMARRGR